MFDVGFWELVLLGVVALVVLGPERLPEVARTVGRWAGRGKQYMRALTEELEREVNTSELRRSLEDAKRDVEDARHDIDSGQQQMETLTRDALPDDSVLDDDVAEVDDRECSTEPDAHGPPAGEEADERGPASGASRADKQ